MSKLVNNNNNKVPIVVGLLISLFGITYIGRLFNGLNLFASSYAGQVVFSDIKKWILAAAIIIIILFWESRKLSSIGFKNVNLRAIYQALLLGIISVILGILTLGVVYNILRLEEPSTLSNIGELPFIVKLLTITTAAVTEEIFYRGYSIERIKELSGSIILGGVISGLIFLAIHYPSWGIAGGVPQLIFTTLLTIFYIKKRNLIACIIMHWIINFFMIIVLPALV